MKKYLSLIIALIFLGGFIPQSVKAESEIGETYYVDSKDGEDTNDGKSKDNSWKTLDKVNEVIFEPGDKILFKSGEVFSGVLQPKGSGIEGAPIIIDMYGGDSKPLFIGKEDAKYVVHLNNIEYLELNNLDISANYKSKGERRGIYIYGKDAGTLSHIYINNIDLHDIKNNQTYVNNNSYKDTGGIIAKIEGSTIPTNYNDLRIENCNIINVDRTGMMLVASSWANRTGSNYGSGRWYPSTNIVVENNNFENLGGDGVIIQQADGALVESNIFNGYAERNQNIAYNCAAWSHNADNTIFQFNEGMNGNSTLDGMPWDSDGYSNNTIFQYNYSHDNDGGAFLLISYGAPDSPSGVSDMRDATFRYNISENDRYALITFTNPLGDNKIYNNVFYVGPGINVKSHIVGSDNNKELGLTLSNNIFYVDEKDGVSGTLNGNWNSKVVYDNNAYYSKVKGKITSLPNDKKMINKDPKFISAGTGEDGYRLQKDSPLINKGKYMINHGSRDYYGNDLYNGAPDIGVNEYSDEKFEVPTEREDEDKETEEVNLFNDPGFESGALAIQGSKNSWAGYGARKITNLEKNIKTGLYAAELGEAETGLNYEITGLKPNIKYKASIWAKIDNSNGPRATMAVQKFENGNNNGKVSVTIDSTEYKEYTAEFTTGSSSTYAWFYVYTSGNKVWIDDANLVQISDTPVVEEINLDELKILVESANEKLNSMTSGEEIGNYPEAIINRLSKSIESAEEVIEYEFAGISKYSIDEASDSIVSSIDVANRSIITELNGDLNGDRIVDIKDLGVAVKYNGSARKQFNDNWDNAKFTDFNGDDSIDFRDVKLLADKIIDADKKIEDSKIELSTSEERYKVGDEFEYIYNVKDLNNILAQDMVIKYNNKVLKLKEVNTSINSRWTYHVFANKDTEFGSRVIMNAAGQKYGLIGNQDIVKLKFEVIGEGKTSVLINDEIVLGSGESVENIQIVKENLIAYENMLGDINEDGIVNIGDLGIASKYKGKVNKNDLLSVKSDLDNDGEVTIKDINIITNIILEI